MFDRGELADAMTEVEHMRTPGESFEHADSLRFELGRAGKQQQRIEIALDRHILRQAARGPQRIDRLIHAERIDPGFAGIGGKLFARAFGKADDRQIGATRAQLADDFRIGSDDPAFKFGGSCTASAPALA